MDRRSVMHSNSHSRRAGRERLARLAAERVVIEAVWPEIDGGRHPVKRVTGDVLEVWADIFSDGHEVLAACICYREAHARKWWEATMRLVDNDRWRGFFRVERNTRYVYTIEAWRDQFATWREDFLKKREAGQDIALELQEGRELVLDAAERRSGFRRIATRLDAARGEAYLEKLLLDADLLERMRSRAPAATRRVIAMNWKSPLTGLPRVSAHGTRCFRARRATMRIVTAASKM